MIGHSLLRAMAHRALHFAVVAVMWVFVVGGATTFAFFYIMMPTRWFYVDATNLIAWRSDLVLQYNFANATTGKATPLLPNTYSFILIWQWCATLATAVGAAGLLWSHSPNAERVRASVSGMSPSRPTCKATRRKPLSVAICMAKGVARVRRLMRWQVPPRGLWRALLGPDGLSVLDLLLLLLWFGLHIMWLREMTMKTLDARRAPAASAMAKVAKSTTKSGNASSSTTTAATATSSIASSASPSNITTGLNAPTFGRLRNLLSVNSSNSGSPTNNTFTKASTSNSTKTTSAKTTSLKPLPREVQNSLAKYAGYVGNLDLLLLFFPLPRCNFLHWLLQSDFPALVKYHRWLGHGTLAMYSLHGIIYMALWTKDGTLSANMQWSMNGYVNNVAGLISLVAGWVLWVTSLPIIRRRFFNLFYISHISSTVVLMLFALMHRKDVVSWVMPGIFLYLLDVVLRTLQQAFNSTVVSAGPTSATASLSPHGSILTLTLECHKALSWAGLDIVFLNVPEISWWQWHPFTLATSSVAGGPETRMVLHIKTYNRWTQRLVARLATDAAPLKLYVSGPYHGAHRKWITNFDRHIFVAGGIGITPVLGMLQDLIERHRVEAAAAGTSRPPRTANRVSLTWLSRSRDELATLPYDILLEASRTGPDAWLDLELYLTAPEDQEQQELASQDENVVNHRRSPSNVTSTAVPVPVGCLATIDGNNIAPATTMATNTSSAFGCGRTSLDSRKSDGSSCAARPLSHPYMQSPLLWAAAVVLCFGGGFVGFICSQAYDAHMSRTVAMRNDYTHVGMLQFAALGLGAALPPALLALAAHVYWEIKSLRIATATTTHQQRLPYKLCDTPAAAKDVSAGCRVGSVLPHSRMSVASATTYPSDSDSASNRNHHHASSLLAPAAVAQTSAQPASPDTAASLATSSNAAKGDHDLIDKGRRLSCTDYAEPFIKRGRPDLKALLEAITKTGGGPTPTVAAETKIVLDREDSAVQNQGQQQEGVDPEHLEDPSDLRVAVFVAGPRQLVEVVEERCATLNGVWGRPGRYYLEVHPLTHEL